MRDGFTDRAVVGKAPCGCIHAAVVIPVKVDARHKQFVNEIVADGLEIQTLPCDEVRAASWSCPTCRPEEYAKQEELILTAPQGQEGEHG